MMEQIEKRSFTFRNTKTRVEPATLGNQAGLFGAAYLPLPHAETHRRGLGRLVLLKPTAAMAPKGTKGPIHVHHCVSYYLDYLRTVFCPQLRVHHSPRKKKRVE